MDRDVPSPFRIRILLSLANTVALPVATPLWPLIRTRSPVRIPCTVCGCAAWRGAPLARRTLGASWRHARYSPVGSPLICLRRPCPTALRRSGLRSSVTRPVAPVQAASLACDFAMSFDRRAAAVSAPVVCVTVRS